MLCPHPNCRHSHGLHSGLGENGRAADGKLLAPNYEAGKCHGGGATPCPCPGWYPDTTPMELAAATMAARAQRNALVDAPPFALTPTIGKGRDAIQEELF